jgi:prevent-host-death family protein
MLVVNIRQAKSDLAELVRKAAAGEEIVIVRGNRPVARLVGMVERKRRPGSLRGKLCVGPEFFEPLPPEELLAWK